MNDIYEVKPVSKPVDCAVSVPGSKSLTNRAFLLAAMARGESVLSNVLFGGDGKSFMDSLTALGYELTVDENARTVALRGGAPVKKAAINVASAGTAARFLTAFLAASEGEYIIDASEQMKARPMKPLLETLAKLGARFEFLERDGCLPFKVTGGGLSGGKIAIDAEQSSQFTSALLMTGVLHKKDLIIKPEGKETAKSYIDITLNMMEQFGVRADRTSDGDYIVKSGQNYIGRAYEIEPDVSGACYFYAASALTGGKVTVNGVHFSSMQGDIKFLDILKKMGSETAETGDGITLKGPERGGLKGIDVDMNDCSDQVITLAAIAPFASSPTVIRNIGHIKHQESDRIGAVLTELSKMGIKCGEEGGGIIIYPGTPRPSAVETYNDHRMAMAFSLAGLRAEGIKILNPGCVSKTFDNYFEVFEKLY